MQEEAKRDFDAVAEKWDEEPRRVKVAEDVAAAIRQEVPLTPEMAALDYGCGSGLVTLGLQPLVRRITGADSSKGMLDVLQRKVRERGIANVETAFLDLEQQGSLNGSYDLIVSSMTMHHVRDVHALIVSLVNSLNRGGWLAVADLQAEDGSFHEDPTGVQHGGFEADFLRSEFSKAGLEEVRVTTAATIDKPGKSAGHRQFPVLLCVGRKP
jgi:2-polyprenyl-3-methyl-5-hydroxy-6-metoxy-1,4-benzoquinol methylase